MTERTARDGAALLKEAAAALRATLHDPRRLAEALIQEQLGEGARFLGDGTRACPWLVLGREADFYALYLRDRDLVQLVTGRPDEVVRVL